MSDQRRPNVPDNDAAGDTDQRSPSNPSVTDTGRRRFTKAGLAAPVIMSLASRPVWGNTGPCSLSGDIFSGNISNHQHECTAGQGCTPGFWKTRYVAWELTGYDPGECSKKLRGKCMEWNATTGSQFLAVFGAGPAKSMMSVMHDSPGSLEFHAVGALLSASHPYIDYGASPNAIINAYYNAYGDLDAMAKLADVLDAMNNRGCPIDASGSRCDDGYTFNEQEICIPVKTN